MNDKNKTPQQIVAAFVNDVCVDIDKPEALLEQIIGAFAAFDGQTVKVAIELERSISEE